MEDIYVPAWPRDSIVPESVIVSRHPSPFPTSGTDQLQRRAAKPSIVP